jgi:hypothetical protein
MIGHCLGAAGGLEAIATIKSITTGWVHPTINQFVSSHYPMYLLVIFCVRMLEDELSSFYKFPGFLVVTHTVSLSCLNHKSLAEPRARS